MEKITTKIQYDSAKQRMEELINEATMLGLLEPDMDNEYTRQISVLASAIADYEDDYTDIMPLRKKSPLIVLIENYFYEHNMKQKEGAIMLGINESVFSQIMNGKRKITMPVAKRLYHDMGIDASTILEYC